MNLSNKRVLVTGGAGFVGSHLVEQLVEAGCRVRVLANYKSHPDIGNLVYVPKDVRESVEIVWGDVSDRDSTTHACQGMQVVFHLAALIGIPYSYVAPHSYVQTNVVGTLNLLQAARAAGVERFVHTSTSETYGSARQVPMDENHPLTGQSPYSATKIGADKLVESFVCSFELPAVTVRPFNVFGPRQSDRAIIPTIIAQRVAGRDPVRIGDPAPKRDFTYVADTARGFVAAASCDAAIGRVINIGNGQSISIGKLTEKICELTGGARFESETHRVRPQASEVSELLASNTLARELLGWRPTVSLDEGLRRTIDFISSHPELYAPDQYRV